MMFFKTKIFLLMVLVAVAVTFYYFGDPQKLAQSIIPKIKSTPLAPITTKLENLDIDKLSQEFQSGVKEAELEIVTLSKKTTEVSEHAGNVLGSSVTPADENITTPMHEKAFEYGKYIYCKQVVGDYEGLNPSLQE